LLSAIALFLFGGEVLHGFAFAMIVGIVTGTYSSIFVAAAIVTFWRRKQLRPATASAAVPSAPAATGAAQSKRSKQRKARAS
jgi:preprotein translocase subunit SecF